MLVISELQKGYINDVSDRYQLRAIGPWTVGPSNDVLIFSGEEVPTKRVDRSPQLMRAGES